MKIYCATSKNKIPPSTMVNRIGKYLKKNLDGAYKYVQGSNQCDIYVTLLYQLKPEFGGEVNDVQEISLDLNITTYQNKIRVNVIEVSPMKRTLGYNLYKPEDLENLEEAKELILNIVHRRVDKAYTMYETLY